jgi:hypothetical protein
MRTSAGFWEIGLSGKIRIQMRPPRLTWREIARRADFDLARRQAATVGGLETEVTECHGASAGSNAGIAALLLLAVLSASWLQHIYSP